MNRLGFISLMMAVLLAGSCAANAARKKRAVKKPVSRIDLDGTWTGALEVPQGSLRLVLHLNRNKAGKLSGTIDSLDQGAMGLPIGQVSLQGRELELVMDEIGGRFEGTANKAVSQIEGSWTQGGMSLPLTLKRAPKPLVIRRPQEPKKPYPYLEEEEVSFENAKAGIRLGGTLTLPKSEKPVPAVILITGSGIQNRDEELLRHKPFLIIADYLTRRGIAVLRVDDRGIGKSTGNPSLSTSEDFAGDVQSEFDYLKTRKEIDSTRIGLLGHSEGGMIAPMVAVQNPEVAFIVLLAGTGVTGEKILYRQGELILRAGGASEDVIARQHEIQSKLFQFVKQSNTPEELQQKVQNFATESMVNLSEEEQSAVKAQLQAEVESLQSPWFRFFLSYDPQPALQKVKCPVLAMNGEKDTQVEAVQNLPAIEEALKAGGNPDYTIERFPGLNHLFQTAKTGSPSEYGLIEETMSPKALKLIGDWICKRFVH